MPNELKFELSQDDLDNLRKIHCARAVQEMIEHPAWPIIQTISQNIIERMENEHLNSASKLDRDSYWIQGAELGGARKYARLLTETIAHQIAALDQNYVRPSGIEPGDLDGDIHGEDN